MTFLAPIVLTGLAAVGVPIAIHLLNKMRVKVIKWAANRFLLAAVQKNQRRLELEDLILLILRCLAVAALILAFARPVINPGGAVGPGMEGGPYTTVVLMDVSASMGQSNGVEIRLDAAKAAATKALDQMPGNTQAALFLVSDQVNPVVPRLTPNLAVLKSTLGGTTPTDRAGEMLPGIRAALDVLRPLSGVAKEILVFTDNQAASWQQLEAIQSELAQEPDVKLRIVSVGETGEDNVAVTAVRPESLVPAVGQLFGCLVEVSNWGASAVTGIRVTLSLGKDAPSDEAVIERVEPGQSATARLSVRFPEAGYHVLTADIPPDRLPADNSRSLAVQVVDSVRAAIVEGATAPQWQDRDGFFIANALTPVAEARRADYFLKTHLEAPTWLNNADLEREELVILTNVGMLQPPAAENLRKYVQAGGSLIIFPGPDVRPADYNDNAVFRELLPATLEPLKDLSGAGGFLAWQDKDYAHPVTLLWNEVDTSTLGSVRAQKFFPLKPVSGEGDAAPRALVSYVDGTPAVVERQVGQGRVVLFSSSGTTQWQNLPIHPNFVPFMQRLTGYLSQTRSPASLNLSPGAVFQQNVSEDLTGREFQVTRPGEEGKPRSAGTVQRMDRTGVIRFRDTEKAGPYRLTFSGDARPVAAFAVQMDPRESNLRTIPSGQLTALETGKEGGDAASAGSGATASAAAPTGRRHEFWLLLVILAALFALAEGALAHRFSISK